MPRQNYSLNNYVGGAKPGYLFANVNTSGTTTIVVGGTDSSWGNLGATAGFFLSINYGAPQEEKVWVPQGPYTWTSPPVTLINVTRGTDGTTAFPQSINYAVVPILAATDLQEANTLVATLLSSGNVVATSGQSVLSTGAGLTFGNVSLSGITGTPSSLSGPGLLASPGALVQSGGYTIWDATTSGINFTTSGVLTATTTSGINLNTHQKLSFTSASGTNILSSGTIVISGSNLTFFPTVLTSGITHITSVSGSLVITSGFGPTTNIEITLGSGTVTSVFGRTGTVTANTGDYTVAQISGAAPLVSPAFTGNPTAPTQTALSDNTKVATTAYADFAVSVETSRATGVEAGLMPISTYDPAGIDQQVVGTTAAQTLTNKRITYAVLTLSANSATPAIDTDSVAVVHITGQTAAITSFSTNMTGTPVDGDALRISITGTTSVALTFGSKFEASSQSLPTTTSGTSRLDMGFFWNSETSKWRYVGGA